MTDFNDPAPSEYKIGNKTYRNLEAQVLKNKKDIEELQQGGDGYELKANKTQTVGPDSTNEEYPSAKAVNDDVLDYAKAIGKDVTVIGQKADRALLIPLAAPTEKRLAGYDEDRAQIQVKLGEGLKLEGETSPYTLKATATGTKYYRVSISDDEITLLDNEEIQNIAYDLYAGKNVVLRADSSSGESTREVIDYIITSAYNGESAGTFRLSSTPVYIGEYFYFINASALGAQDKEIPISKMLISLPVYDGASEDIESETE